MEELAEELKSFRWDGVRLLISGGKADKRRNFYKTLEKYYGLRIHRNRWFWKNKSGVQEMEGSRRFCDITLPKFPAPVFD